MKKAITKIVFLMACIAGIIFLLLPFLETTPPATTDLKSVTPQVASSNPLSIIARRLKSLFGLRLSERNPQKFSAVVSGENTYIPPAFTERISVADTRAAHLPGKTQEKSAISGTVLADIPVPPVSVEQYADASLQTDSGEWVLVRQTAPESGAPGMHEVNVHEDPYTRYVKQERARRFQSAVTQTQIPDSTWARLWRPIQSFFGLEGARPVPTRSFALTREKDMARRGAGNGALGQSRYVSLASRRTRLPWPDISPVQWNQMTPEERQHERERRDVADFVDMLSGTRAAEESAGIVADATYPEPRDEGKKEALQTRLSAENKQKIKEGILSAMRANAEGQKAVDELPEMVGCTNASLPKSGCTAEEQETDRPLFSADELQTQQEKNARMFLESTHYAMPKDLPLLMVMGPTTPEAMAEMGGATEDVNKTIEIYQFLYDKQHCATQTCFWIPNTIQKDKRLTEALRMANAKAVMDPDNMYPGLLNDFEQYKKEQVQKQASEHGGNPSSVQKQEVAKQFTENAPGWIPVTAEQLKNIHQRYTVDPVTSRTANPQNGSLAILYGTNPVHAEDIYHAIGDHVTFAYAKKPLTSAVGDLVDGQSMDQADKQVVFNTAELITQSLAENFNTALAEVREVTQQSVAQGARAGLSPANPPQQNGQGMSVRDAIQNRNTRAGAGKK